jgi:hypothetical protein
MQMQINGNLPKWVIAPIKRGFMENQFQERFKIILTKVVNGRTFTLELHERFNPDSYNEETRTFKSEGYDYIIAGPNWLSGYLKAQGYNEFEIFEYFDQVSSEDVRADWEARSEQVLFSSGR